MACCANGTCVDPECPICVELPRRFPPVVPCPRCVLDSDKRMRCRLIANHPGPCRRPYKKTNASPDSHLLD